MNYYLNCADNHAYDPFLSEVFGFKEALMSDKFGTIAMNTDIEKADGGFMYNIELAGFKKENISISYENQYLTVKVFTNTLKKNDKGEAEAFLHRERFAGSASRQYYVGDIDEKLIKANFADGVLSIFVPEEKSEEESVHQIAIN